MNAPETVRRTHQWFEVSSGWSPPNRETLAEWMADGVCRCPDECWVRPAESCPHGLASWWLVLATLDRPDGEASLPPVRLTPHPDRLCSDRPDYVEVMTAHHQALLQGDAGYVDPTTDLFVQTARTLWSRGSCCEQGCRHCPYLDR